MERPNPKEVGYSQPYPCGRCGEHIRYQYGIHATVEAYEGRAAHSKKGHLPYVTYPEHHCRDNEK